MASQFFATKGQRPKYNYTDAINAQTPYLPQRYQLKANREQQLLENEQNEQFRQDQLKFGEKQLAQQEEDAALAKKIGIANLGVKGLTAYGAFKGKDEAVDKIASTAGNAIKSFDASADSKALTSGSDAVQGANQGLLGKTSEWLKPNQSIGDLFSPGSSTKWGESFNAGNLITGGGTGMMAGALLGGKDPEKWKSSLMGGGVGAAANYLTSGGDLYSAAVGGLGGSVGGFISSLFLGVLVPDKKKTYNRSEVLKYLEDEGKKHQERKRREGRRITDFTGLTPLQAYYAVAQYKAKRNQLGIK